MKNGKDRFGMPNQNLDAARKRAQKQKNGKYAFQCYVPTRQEVNTLSPAALRPILIGWMCHSPTEIIPSRTQIGEVRLALLGRKDCSQLADLIEMCKNYINYS